MRDFYDVMVIGGGHAGAEAAWAAASILSSQIGEAARVALVTMDPSKIGVMSCNPAIGGLAKGQMVREIDALGGMMGLVADATGIMFKVLNMSKGAAVRGPRAQCDKYAYAAEVQRLLSSRSNIDVISGTVDNIVVEHGRAIGVVLPTNSAIAQVDPFVIERNVENANRSQPIYPASTPSLTERTEHSRFVRTGAIVLTTGTFMRALMHMGDTRKPGGRVNEGSAVGISHTLRALGLELGRLKTGTPPRLARESIDWESLDPQFGDAEPTPFSDLPAGSTSEGIRRSFPVLPQIECRVTRTTNEAHDVIRKNLHRAPMYSGAIDAECGPRYCPSIEDKVVRFSERDSHHVFLEPESLHTSEIYCNGISTSLPTDVQDALVRSMPGCAKADIIRYGYAVEYDMVWPHQIDSTGMTKAVAGLFLAGQINGTSGYEEAAGQGLVAGLNAALLAVHMRTSSNGLSNAALVESAPMIRLARDQAYIGVMMDDLVTRTPREPYRMFTSRAEHRLLLRADNADERLTPLARELGLADDLRWQTFEQRQRSLDDIRRRFDRIFVDGKPLREFARRPDATREAIAGRVELQCDPRLLDRAVIESRYEGYISRQRAEVRRQSQADAQRIPEWLHASDIVGLRRESAETLARFRPKTIGQASRLAGITPADLTLLAVHIKRGRVHARSKPWEPST